MVELLKIKSEKIIKKIPTDLSIILVWYILTIIFILILNPKYSFIRTVLGIPSVLFIPGYVLISALFPKQDDLDSIERIALSFGLSIAVVPLIGLGLNYTPFGIRLMSIITSLTIFTVFLVIIGIYRREELSEDEKFVVQFHKIYLEIIGNINKPQNKKDTILTIVLIFSIMLALGMLIYVVVTPKVGEKFSEFYILNSTGKADNYSTNLKIGLYTNYLVGVVNHEYSPTNYTVEVVIDKDILISKKLELDNDETWENNISISPDRKGNNMKLEFWLFKEKNFTEPYRELHLWISAT